MGVNKENPIVCEHAFFEESNHEIVPGPLARSSGMSAL
jgi:hypothetical protein